MFPKSWLFLIAFFIAILTSTCVERRDEMRERFIKAIATDFEKTFVTTFLDDCSGVRRQFKISSSSVDISHLRIDLWHGRIKETFKLDELSTRFNTSSHFNASLPIVLFLHGFLSNSDSSSSLSIVHALINRGGYNVFAIDAGSLLKKSYLWAINNAVYIGQHLGEILASMLNDDIKSDDIHIIGHSLGAHIGGFAGKRFENITGSKIGRISALDPAGPCFFEEGPLDRLDSGDAVFVDVIHTNAGVYGYVHSIGDVDFYPNNGVKQPGCSNSNCSHARSWELYAESINHPKVFATLACKSWYIFSKGLCSTNQVTFMGFDVDVNSRGMRFLRTSGASPYGMGESGIQKLTSFDWLMYWYNMTQIMRS